MHKLILHTSVPTSSTRARIARNSYFKALNLSGQFKNGNWYNLYMDSRIIKEFSKENSPEERSELAKELWEDRRSIQEKRRRQEEIDAKINKVTEGLGDLSENLPKRIFNFLKIRKLRNELERDVDIRQKIRDFYQSEKERWEKLPFDKEEMAKQFSEENLSRLSLEDYVLILKKYGSNMVTHVTRQGIRDHIGMIDHSKGLGKKHDGFLSLLKEGVLRSGLGLRVAEQEKEKRILADLNAWGGGIETEEQAIQSLDNFTHPEVQLHAAKYLDFHSVHFAARQVADAYYGAESGNEIFVAYPANFIAANYFYRRDPNQKVDDLMWNDVWVYDHESKGVKIDAGIIFIPADAKVDSETGSQYEITEEQEAVIDIGYEKQISDLAARPEFIEFAKKAEKVLGSTIRSYDEFKRGGVGEEYVQIYADLISDCQKIGINDEKILHTILDYRFLFSLRVANVNGEPAERAINNRLLDERTRYKRPGVTISSQEYWENYFNKNPELKPSKLIFYSGGNPSGALEEWLSRNGLRQIEKTSDFPEHSLLDRNRGDLPAPVNEDIKRFKDIALRAIRNHFGKE
jgi:hypothetical protein